MNRNVVSTIVITVLLVCSGKVSAKDNESCFVVTFGLRDSISLLKSKAEMEKAESECSGFTEFHYQYGYVLERLMKYDKALAQYRKAIELDGKVAKYYSRAAGLLKTMKKHDEATRYLRLALQLEPDNSDYAMKLSRLQGHAASTTASSPAKGSEPSPDESLPYANFQIDRTEVSVRDFQTLFPDYLPPEGFTPDMPAVNISFREAREYAEKRGGRLCSRQEWLHALKNQEAIDLHQCNLHKEFYSYPYPVVSGSGEVKNLLGNVAEWVTNGKQPGHIGGHWFSGTMLQATLEQTAMLREDTGTHGKKYVGFRCCQDTM